MRESKVEAHLVQRVEKLGGLCEKVVSLGKRGFPDRLVTWPWGIMRLVELKRPGGVTEEHQDRDHERRAKRGITVYVLDTIEKIDRWLDDETYGNIE